MIQEPEAKSYESLLKKDTGRRSVAAQESLGFEGGHNLELSGEAHSTSRHTPHKAYG